MRAWVLLAGCSFQPAAATPAAPDAPPGAFVLDTSTQAKGQGTTLTWPHTVGPTADVLLVVGVSIEKQSGAEVASISYAGAHLTRAASMVGGGGVRAELWYLPQAETGSHAIAVTLTTAATQDGVSAGAISLGGATSAAPVAATAMAGATSGSPATTVADAPAGAWVIDAITVDNGSAATPGGGQVERWSEQQGMSGFGSTVVMTAAGASTMTWVTTQDNWAQVAAAFVP
jgi:hypothetical protein